jgi:hypothetical protein
MARWFPVESADANIFNSAPHVFRYELHYDATPERVWDSLQSDASLSAWGRSVSELIWTTPRPFGVGTTREIALAPGVARVRERFFRWDEGRGYSFYVYEANAPLFRRFAEDYSVEPAGAGTRFRWVVALEPRAALTLPFKPIAPVLKFAFGRLASDGQKYFAAR